MSLAIPREVSRSAPPRAQTTLLATPHLRLTEQPRSALAPQTDASSLLQSRNIKDALLRKLEAALVQPPPPKTKHGLSPRAAGLLANSQRREAALQIKVKGLQVHSAYEHTRIRMPPTPRLLRSLEQATISGFQEREARAVEVNELLKRQLKRYTDRQEHYQLRHEVTSRPVVHRCVSSRPSHSEL